MRLVADDSPSASAAAGGSSPSNVADKGAVVSVTSVDELDLDSAGVGAGGKGALDSEADEPDSEVITLFATGDADVVVRGQGVRRSDYAAQRFTAAAAAAAAVVCRSVLPPLGLLRGVRHPRPLPRPSLLRRHHQWAAVGAASSSRTHSQSSTHTTRCWAWAVRTCTCCCDRTRSARVARM